MEGQTMSIVDHRGEYYRYRLPMPPPYRTLPRSDRPTPDAPLSLLPDKE